MNCPSCGGVFGAGRCGECGYALFQRSRARSAKDAASPRVDVAPGISVELDQNNPAIQEIGRKLTEAQAQVGGVLEDVDAVRRRAEQLLPALEELGQATLEVGAKLKRFLRGT